MFELRWLRVGPVKVLQLRTLKGRRRSDPFNSKSVWVEIWSDWQDVPTHDGEGAIK